jgi:peptidyl-Lys metalloendopeptidase
MKFYGKTLVVLRSVLSVALYIVASSAAANVPSGIKVEIEPLKASYSSSDSLNIRIRYTNVTQQSIRFLKWDTALEGRIDADILAIQGERGFLPYVGREYKRAAPTSADFISLAAGHSLTVTVDVSDGYSLGVKGEYLLGYRSTDLSAGLLSTGPSVSLRLRDERSVIAFKRTPTTDSCVGNRPTLIDSAVSAAESIARRARDDLSNTPISLRSSARRYREWFGVYSQGRWNTVQDHFNRINSALSSQVLNFICDDTTNAFAYVFPSQPYNIYLGGAFWNAPRTGTDSKAGTIIHELSHFTILADTDDVVYGQSGARSLANSNPSNAVRNADSYEYFAENTPFLPMPTSADLVLSDLALTSSEILNLSPIAGASGIATGFIANQGDAASSSGSLVLRVVDNAGAAQITQIALPAIAKGAGFAFELDYIAPILPGEYTAELCISGVNGESNTSNNCSAVQQITVRPRIVIVPMMELLLGD